MAYKAYKINNLNTSGLFKKLFLLTYFCAKNTEPRFLLKLLSKFEQNSTTLYLVDNIMNRMLS